MNSPIEETQRIFFQMIVGHPHGNELPEQKPDRRANQASGQTRDHADGP
jgi:hypothetical protein